MEDLKFRARLSSSVDKGLVAAFRVYSYYTNIPLSRLLDEAVEDFLQKHNIPYTCTPSYSRRRIEDAAKTNPGLFVSSHKE